MQEPADETKPVTGEPTPARPARRGGASDAPGWPEWKGPADYEIVRRIGSGGMGVVYEAIDRRTAQHVALKTLIRFDPAGLYGFKQEFRTLADVHHRNLVHLQELVVTETDPVFFTMELVAGADFLEYVTDVKAGARPRGYAESTTDGTSKALYGLLPALSPAAFRACDKMASLSNLEKLRPALRQLVEGLHALHRTGKLHRDIKPSNVLVTPEGRVVLLDFGVATDLLPASPAADTSSSASLVVGTPTYMSPEQGAAETVTGATDMYSVGVMLYEALVGRPPFTGDAIDVIARKMTLTPPAPSECVGGVPRDLDDLCVGLLRIDPAARPSSRDVLRLLGSTSRTRSDAPGRGDAETLVGRADERRALRDAFDATLSGQAVTVRVSGTGGMGKSALVRSFVAELVADGQTNVLAARVYERESVPYKAVDGVIDALSQLLVDVDEYEGGVALPRHMRELARLFPVLRRVQSLGPQLRAPEEDPQAERRRAFRALRECLTSFARRRPLVVFIDDVQWGDTDSVALLVDVMRPPNAPPLLLVMTSREEDADKSPFLMEMASSWSGDVREIRVGPLPASEAQLLALSFLGSSDARAESIARAIVNEARGSPLLIEELVRSHRHHLDVASTALAVVTLEQVVGRRLDNLPPEARRLAEVVAVAGRPLPVATLAAASGLENDLGDTFALLQDQGLARVSFRADREVAEPVHDRIRETVVRLLPPDRLREHHGRLANVLETTAGADLEAIAVHMLGAGHAEDAVRFARRAADEAASKLAFDQAARLLRTALDATSPSSLDAKQVRVRLAQVLELAGRATAAADEYTTAARSATAIERIELERAAAEQLLLCGRVEEGKLALLRVLGAMGMSAPRSAAMAVLFLFLYQFRLRLVGVRFRERDAADVSRENRVRVDSLHAVSVGMGPVDLILGACMQAKHLLVAMERGDRTQVLRALGFEIIQFAVAGRPESRRERRVLELARGLASRVGPEGEAYLARALGIALYMRGRYRVALEKLEAAGPGTPGAAGNANARLFGVFACFFLGRLREEARRARRLLRDVEDRGDAYTTVSLQTTVMVDMSLVADDPDTAKRHLREALTRWTQSGFNVQHWYAMCAEAHIALYEGDGERARARLETDRRALRRSFLLHSQLARGFTNYLRGCCAIASIDASPSLRVARVAEARRMAKRLGKERAAWGPTFAAIVRAAAANAAGERSVAVVALREALGHAEEADLGLHAWAVRYQLGMATGGDAGRELVSQAERAMTDEGVRAPARMAALLVPGRWS